MIVKLRDKNIELRNTIRMYVMFEAVKKEPFNPSLVTDLLLLLYSCVVCAGAKGVTYDEVIELVDGSPSILPDFVAWLAQEGEKQRAYIGDADSDSKKKD